MDIANNRAKRPFIPRNKPRFWVVFVLACLTGMGIGLIGFGAAWLELELLQKVAMALFMVCWGIAAVSWFGFIVGLLSVRYRGLQEKSWKEQVW